MSVATELRRINQEIEALQERKRAIYETETRHPPCLMCRWRSHPNSGIQPRCIDVKNGNYSRRLAHIEACKRHPQNGSA